MKSLEYKKTEKEPRIVWLDTNIIISIRNSLRNHKGDQFAKLFNILKKKVEEGKIICPFSGQRSEYSQGISLEESDDILISLSKGFQVSMWQIRQEQVKTAIKCFLDNDTEFILKDSDLIYKKDRKNRENHNFEIIILNEKSKKEEREILLHDLIRRKKEVEELNLSYDKLFKSEQDAGITVLQLSINENINQYGYLNLKFNINDYWYHRLYTIIELQNISKTKNQQDLIKLAKKFLSSNYFYAIPIDKISTTIIADILTNKKEMVINDIGDMHNLSVILPYASYLITDKAMAHILKSRKLDSEFNTKIYSIKTIDHFIEDIENI